MAGVADAENLARQTQADRDRAEFENTVRVQRAQNGFVIKTVKGPFVFADWNTTAKWLGEYFTLLDKTSKRGV